MISRARSRKREACRDDPHQRGGVLYIKPPKSASTNNTMNTKKNILPASHITAPVKGKPRKAATRAIRKNSRAKRNMMFSFLQKICGEKHRSVLGVAQVC